LHANQQPFSGVLYAGLSRSVDMLSHVLRVGFAGFVAYTARPGASDSSKLVKK